MGINDIMVIFVEYIIKALYKSLFTQGCSLKFCHVMENWWPPIFDVLVLLKQIKHNFKLETQRFKHSKLTLVRKKHFNSFVPYYETHCNHFNDSKYKKYQ